MRFPKSGFLTLGLFAVAPIVFLLELFDASGTVDVLHLPGIKRVALRANIDMQFLDSATSCEFLATTAGDFGFDVIGVNVAFHDSKTFLFGASRSESSRL